MKYRLMSLALVACFVLSACSSAALPKQPDTKADTDYEYVATIDITETQTKESLELNYGGEAFLVDAESGFALIGFSQSEGELSTLDKNANKDAFEVSVQGTTSWAHGVAAWANGYSAWTQGFSAWAEGNSSSTDGFTENTEAWDLIKLGAAHKAAPNLGEGTVVAIIDTGVDLEHPAIQHNLVPSHLWKDYIDGDQRPQEEKGKYYGHGTAVAGIVLQVAPKAQIMPIRVLEGNGKGDLADVARAMNWAIKNGADVINLSLGSNKRSNAVSRLIKKAYRNGVLVTVSAGNSGKKHGLTFPAVDASKSNSTGWVTISVGSVTNTGKRSDFSNYGSGLELMTPGNKIHSLFPDKKRGAFSGTSFSAPMAAGALALGLSAKNIGTFDREYVTDDLVYEGDRIKIAEKNVDPTSLGNLMDLERFVQAIFRWY